MDCSSLPGFLEGDLTAEAQAQFEQHLVTCAACQTAVEHAMQLCALGAELAKRVDRPRAAPGPADLAARRTARRARRWLLGAAALPVAAACAIAVLALFPRTLPVERELTAHLAPDRMMLERVPYTALDRHRDYNAMRAGPAHAIRPAGAVRIDAVPGEQISMTALAALEKRGATTELIAALIAQGDLAGAEQRLQHAGPGDSLDVERAIVAQRRGQGAAALGLLDQVLARSPRNTHAMWNRAIALTDLDLPLAAAEAFDASAALGEPGWSQEAASRRDDLRSGELDRARRLMDVVKRCGELSRGAIPDADLVQRHAAMCRPSLYVALRRATTRDEVQALMPVARALDAAAGDTTSSALVERIAAADFRARAPSVALYTRLRTSPAMPIADQLRIVEQLRATGQSDLVLGALLQVIEQRPAYIDELARLARADRDPYLDEIATEYDAVAKLASGKALEAELTLRQAVQHCATRDVELRCSYLHQRLADLYLARHRPTEATETALGALARSRRLGLYWDERLLFGFLAQAAQLARDYPRMRAFSREARLRVPACDQIRQGQEAIAGAELTELRFASARTELDQATTCDQPMTLERAQIEAELARLDGAPARIAELRHELDRTRHSGELSPGGRALVDALEGRLLAPGDPAAARSVLRRAIAAADALGFEDVEGTKARNHAYRSLLVAGAGDQGAPALLALFAAAGRAPLRPGCTLGALVDGERLLLVARDAGGKVQQVFEPHAFKTPDIDPRTVVPPAMVSALSSCARVDVIALPPLYGQPQLLPPGLAWSYRGPAGAPPPPPAARRPSILTIEDARPPAALELPRLASPSHAPHAAAVDEVILRGAEATPARVRGELVQADFAEFHAHGFVDLGISDVSLIALSPDHDGSFALTARVIAGLKLVRAPFITLAACDAAYTAPYLHEPWSLPYAFLLAGARGVLAPATTIPDKEADGFFRAVGDQILGGVDPAVVLRDQRLQRHGGASDWVNGVVLFD